MKCKQCGKEYRYSPNKGMTYKLCSKCRIMTIRNKVHDKKILALGDKCCRCKYDKCTGALTIVYNQVLGRELVVCLNCQRELYLQSKIDLRKTVSPNDTQNYSI